MKRGGTGIAALFGAIAFVSNVAAELPSKSVQVAPTKPRATGTLAPRPVDGAATISTEGVPNPCVDVVSSYNTVAQSLTVMFAKLRDENRQEIATLDTNLTAPTPSIAALNSRIAVLDTTISSLNLSIANSSASCAAVQEICEQRLYFISLLNGALAEKVALVQERDQLQATVIKSKLERKAQLQQEDAQLANQLNVTLQALAVQKAKAMADCAKLLQDQQATAAAASRFCGKSVGAGSKSKVVVVGATPAATRGMASLEQTLGTSFRTSAGALLTGNEGAKLTAVRAALAQSTGKALVIDGGGAFAQPTTSRVERASQDLVVGALQLDPRIVLIRVDGAIGPRERTLASSRGWRVAEDTDGGIRAAICAP